MDNHYFMAGPMRCSHEVLQACAQPIFGHRTPRFRHIYKDIISKVGQVLFTEGRVAPVVCSGSGGIEFMLSNLIHPDDEVLCLVNGHFSQRLYQQAQAYNNYVKQLRVVEGDAVTIQKLKTHLELTRQNPNVLAVVSSETSTGAWTDIKAISEFCTEHDIMLLVDHVSGVGNPYYMDQWGIDATVTTTHESFFAPPGLAIVAFSQRAVEKAKQTPKRNLYMHLPTYLKSIDSRGEPPFTVPTTLAEGLSRNLSLLLDEGMSHYFHRCGNMAMTMRRGLQTLGFNLFTKPYAYNNTITAVKTDIDAVELTEQLREQFGINIATGKGALKHDILRIGHCGVVQPSDVIWLLRQIRVFMEQTRMITV